MEVAYQAIYDATIYSISIPSFLKDQDEDYFPAWEVNSTYSYDFLDIVMSLDESILKDMIGIDQICEDLHHKSYF